MSDTCHDSSEAIDAPQPLEQILAELMRAMDAGSPLDADQWIARHPEYGAELREFFQQHQRFERLVRPLREAASHSLHVRCPHCHHPIELLEEVSLNEISCPSCGSSFSLVADAAPSRFSPGAKALGHFELLDRVGVGQFGSVWKARDTNLDRTVAIKIPRKGQLDQAQTELFLRDARAAAQLKHPNIVSVHEVGKQDDTIYIVSDFIQGSTLKEWIARGRLTPRESAELCVKIARALHHAHEVGVVHRDLKPGNIMMAPDGEPHVVDFGLAKRESGEITMTIEGQILGTPAYMSPEQARGQGHTVDRRADIYSLGVILFELMTGELPFRGDKQMLIVQLLYDDPPTPRKLNSSVPRELETICLKCLEKEPSQRFYRTSLELAEDIECYLNNEPIRARPTHSVVRGLRWACKHLAAVGLGLTSLLAIALLIALITRGFYSDHLEASNRKLEDSNRKLNDEKMESNRQKQRAEANEKRAREFMYSAHIVLAGQAIELGDTKHVYELLDPFRHGEPDLRGPEWLRMWRQIRGDEYALRGSADILCLTYSSDGDRLVSGTKDGRVTIWNLNKKAPAVSMQHTSSLRCVTLLPGREEDIVFADVNGKVFRWTPETGRMAPIPSRPPEMAARLWDHLSRASAAERKLDAVSGDSTAVVDNKGSYSRRSLMQVSRSENRLRCEIVVKSPSAGVIKFLVEGEVQSVAIAPSGRLVAVGGIRRQQDGPSGAFVKVFDLQDIDSPLAFECGNGRVVGSLCFRADERQLAGGLDREIKVWNMETAVDATVDTNVYSAIGLTRDGTHLATIHSQPNRVVIRDPTTGDPCKTLLGSMGQIYDAAFISHGEELAAAGRGGVEIWNVQTGEHIRVLGRPDLTVKKDISAFGYGLYTYVRVRSDPRCRYVAATGFPVSVWEMDTGKCIYHEAPKRTRWITGLAFSPSGQSLAVSRLLDGVKVLRVDDWSVICSIDPGFPIMSLTFTPDSKHLVGVGASPHVWIWDVETGATVGGLSAKTKEISDVSYTARGTRLITGHIDGTVTLWNTATDTPLMRLGSPIRAKRTIYCALAASSDGSRIAFTADGRATSWCSGNTFHEASSQHLEHRD